MMSPHPEVVRLRRLAILMCALGVSNASGATPEPTDTVRLWLNALHDGNADALASLTALPFAYGEAWPNKQCTRVVKNSVGVPQWLACIQKKEDLLIRELGRGHGDPNYVELRPGVEGASKKLRSLAKSSSKEGAWVSGVINGDGVTYEFLFHLDGDETSRRRVSSFFIDVSFDSG